MLRYVLIVSFLAFLIGNTSCGGDTGNTGNYADSLLPKEIVMLNKRIIDDPDNASLYHERGKEYFKNRMYTEALSDLQRTIKADSSVAEFYITLADIYLATNKTRGTREALEKAISVDPKNTQAMMKLAELLFLVKYYDESLKYLDEALKVDQYNAKAYYMKGMNYLEKGDTNTAISSMQTAVEQDQKYYDAYMQIGLLYAGKHNPIAIDYYDNAIRIQPHSAEAYYDKGKFYQDIKEWDKAIMTYNALLAIDPNYKHAYYNLGAIELLTTQKYDKAITHFDKAIKADPQYVEAYYARGSCYQATGNKKKALEDYSLALQINPNYEPALTAAASLQGK